MADAVVLNSISSLRNVEDQYLRAFESTMRKLDNKIIESLDTVIESNIIDAALARQEIERILIDSGYYETVGSLLNEGYQDAINEVYSLYLKETGENFQFAEATIQRLNAIKTIDLGQYSQLASDFSNRLTRVYVDINYGAISKAQAIKSIGEQLDTMTNYARTWVTTGLSAIYRESSTALAIDNGMKEFIYAGPLDNITRDFCVELLTGSKGRKYTADEISKLDNGQGLPVMQYGGGWNCRHQWVGVK